MNFWTEEKLQHLSGLWSAGRTTTDIARELGCTKGAVVGKLSHLRKHGDDTVAARRGSEAWSRDDQATLLRLARSGVSYENIARELRRSKGSVEKRLRVLGMRRGRQAPVAPTPLRSAPARSDGFGAKIHSLLDLTENDCRWPIGEPGTAGFGFCGAPKIPFAESYCTHHQRIAYLPPPDRRRVAKSSSHAVAV